MQDPDSQIPGHTTDAEGVWLVYADTSSTSDQSFTVFPTEIEALRAAVSHDDDLAYRVVPIPFGTEISSFVFQKMYHS